jgi:hypothetical protein
MPLNLKAFIANRRILAIRKINDLEIKCSTDGNKVKRRTTTRSKVESIDASDDCLGSCPRRAFAAGPCSDVPAPAALKV